MFKSVDFLKRLPKIERQETMIYSSKHKGLTVPIYNRPNGDQLYKQWVTQIETNKPLDGVVEFGMVSPSKVPIAGTFFDGSDEL